MNTLNIMSNLNTSETEYSEARAFWKSRLALIDATETGNGNNHLPANEERFFLTEGLQLSETFKNRLADITDDPLTAFGIITSMFSLLFNRYQSSTPVVFMIPFLKNESNDEQAFGMFPLLLRYEKEDTLKAYLNNAVQVIEDCFNYADSSVEFLAREEFGWQTIAVSDILVYSELHLQPENEAQFGIRINIAPDIYKITVEYDPLVFPEYRAKLLQGHWGQLENAFNDVDVPVSAVEILTQHEISQLSGFDLPVDEKIKQTIIDLFNETVKSCPNKIALYFESHAVTYKELDTKSSRLAQYFQQEQGIQPG